MSLVVRLRSAVCLLGRFPALAGVDLDLASGEAVLLSGGNGAGKTTLLRLVAGLLPLHQGEGEVLGCDLRRDRRSHRRRIGFVGHDTGGYDDLTVRENIRFATKAVGAGVESADEALSALELDRLADVHYGKLSTGQRRRTGLAIALARRPDLLLLDEPHAGLDAPGRAYLDRVLAGSAGEGRSVLIASHELDLVRPFVSREVVLTNGQAHGTVPTGATPAAARGPVETNS
ncbi:MAG: heme ABC exporter ATP-binding protein CcmA [Actinomycetota bacterium]